MRRNWMIRGLRFALFALLAAAVFSLVTMSLWNWLMPALFGLRAITFWQALGLLVLSRILLGGFRGRPGHAMHWRRRMHERWERMTSDEREKFRQGMRERCGHRSAPQTQA
jgi:lipopolysaccharide export LptBFGC system permease protein LptF